MSAADALAECERWVAGGRRLDAIEMLTEVNRDEHNDGIERRLVQLRHRAFADLPERVATPVWPPEGVDLFPSETGVPEVPASQFNAETLRSGIVQHGCLIVRGLLKRKRVTQLIDDIDRAFAGYDAWAAGTPVAETEPWFVPFTPATTGHAIGPERKWVSGGGGVWTVDSPRAMFDVLETFEDFKLLDTLTGYLGERPAMSMKKWTLRRVPLTAGTSWHQDGAFLGKGIRTVNLWVSLSRCGDEAPGLEVIPKRFDRVLETGTDGAIFDWAVGDAAVTREAGDAPVTRPIFNPGDAILFDEMNLHRTVITPEMTRERYAIESWFFAPSCYPDEQIPVTL